MESSSLTSTPSNSQAGFKYFGDNGAVLNMDKLTSSNANRLLSDRESYIGTALPLHTPSSSIDGISTCTDKETDQIGNLGSIGVIGVNNKYFERVGSLGGDSVTSSLVSGVFNSANSAASSVKAASCDSWDRTGSRGSDVGMYVCVCVCVCVFIVCTCVCSCVC
jgi:hypothetical protein